MTIANENNNLLHLKHCHIGPTFSSKQDVKIVRTRSEGSRPQCSPGSDNRPFACHDFVRVLEHPQPALTPHKMLTIVSDARIKMFTMAPDARMHRGLAVEPFRTAEESGPGSLKRRSQEET